MKALRVAADSSCLIALAQIQQFDLLRELFAEVYVPRAVYDEITVAGKGEAGADETINAVEAGWIILKEVRDIVAVSALTTTLGMGESEVLVLCKEHEIDYALIDEKTARNMAALMDIDTMGTLGVIDLAAASKKEGQGFMARESSLRAALYSASSEVTIAGFAGDRFKNTASCKLSRVLRLCLMMSETPLLIWLLSRSMTQKEVMMSFENSDKHTRKSSAVMTPSFSFLVNADTNSVIVILATAKTASGLSNKAFTVSEPASTWYLFTSALVSKKYTGIICFFLLR